MPFRSPAGHRRYDRQQVEQIKEVARRIGLGRPISELIAEAREGPTSGATGPDAEATAATGWTRYADQLIEALSAGDLDEADAIFDGLAARLDVDSLIAEVISPTLSDVGERLFRRESRIYEEHCITGFLRRKLDVMIDSARRTNRSSGHRVIVGSVLGDRHEGGGLIVSLMLERAGWRVINLGADLPVREFRTAIERYRPDALALSFVLSRNINKRFLELSEVRDLPVFVGGRSVLNYQRAARRHGLIPIVCPIEGVAEHMASGVREWYAHTRA